MTRAVREQLPMPAERDHSRSGTDPQGIPGAGPLPERAEPATERLSAKTAAALVRRAAVRARCR